MHNKFDVLKSLCRKHGMRLTPQRLEIFNAVDGTRDHPSAFEVYNRVNKLHPSISLDTVYRTLDTFEQWGLLNKLSFLFEKIRYDADLSDHYHIVCTECGNIWDFKWTEFSSIDVPDELSKWGKLNKKDVLVQGICSECLKKGRK
jgi:Fur family transcriptional regulator, peroxide stress response regulator